MTTYHAHVVEAVDAVRKVGRQPTHRRRAPGDLTAAGRRGRRRGGWKLLDSLDGAGRTGLPRVRGIVTTRH